MLEKSFMFSVDMLADMLGANKQYLSKKVKQMTQDPEMKLQAVIRSRKEGYLISEEEVLRCFDKVTPGQVREYKECHWAAGHTPKARKLTRQENKEETAYLEKENEMIIEWKIHLAATAPDKKNTPEMREYLKNEIERIQDLKVDKMKDYCKLEMFFFNCDKMIAEIQQRLSG